MIRGPDQVMVMLGNGHVDVVMLLRRGALPCDKTSISHGSMRSGMVWLLLPL